jgi:hypothetical protein
LEYRWNNKNLNVEKVVTKAEQFLKDRNFIINREESENSVKFDGVKRREKYEVRSVEIVISWEPQELSVKFEVGDHLKPIMHLGSLISVWGGGSLVLKELKAAEQYRRLEDEFWREMEEIVSA